jgi:phosphatidylethanolamine/phosphatidyl-N-methylethanolamine N-methyltransferase
MPGTKADRSHWDQAAQTYDAEYERTIDKRFEHEMRAWLGRQFTDADHVLELGCGTGLFSVVIAERVRHLTATDFSPEMLEQARRRLDGHDNVEIRTEDAYDTSFADGSFSAVLAANLLHHADEPARVVEECRRVLAPGGRAVIIDCAGHGPTLWSRIGAVLGRLRGRQSSSEDHHHFSLDDLTALLTDGGLTVEEKALLRQGRPPMGFICIRAVKAD